MVVRTVPIPSAGMSKKKKKAWECIYPDDEILSELAAKSQDLPASGDEGRRLLIFDTSVATIGKQLGMKLPQL